MVSNIPFSFSIGLHWVTDPTIADILLHLQDAVTVVRNTCSDKWDKEKGDVDTHFCPTPPFLVVISAFSVGAKVEVIVRFLSLKYRLGLLLTNDAHLPFTVGEVIICVVQIPLETIPKKLHFSIPVESPIGETFYGRGEESKNFYVYMQSDSCPEADILVSHSTNVSRTILKRK
ncbi:uncharacterized protein LOC143226582 isoform X2 [Tachypleus tridentatus]|uniref:uncharacterized protein LOC143226582 isoform X2 n=1 Tax=Tachypleus tridentatus TaxID=6853 RepID=UPI003FD33481